MKINMFDTQKDMVTQTTKDLLGEDHLGFPEPKDISVQKKTQINL